MLWRMVAGGTSSAGWLPACAASPTTSPSARRSKLRSGHVVLRDSPDAGSLLWHNYAFLTFPTREPLHRLIDSGTKESVELRMRR